MSIMRLLENKNCNKRHRDNASRTFVKQAQCIQLVIDSFFSRS